MELPLWNPGSNFFGRPIKLHPLVALLSAIKIAKSRTGIPTAAIIGW
jgi:hypothetical protein